MIENEKSVPTVKYYGMKYCLVDDIVVEQKKETNKEIHSNNSEQRTDACLLEYFSETINSILYTKTGF